MAELPAARRVSAYQSHDKRSGSPTIDGDFKSNSSYDAGESSTAGSFLALTPAAGAMDRPLGDGLDDKPLDDYGSRHSSGHAHRHGEDGGRRRQKKRATSAFLLHDAVPRDREGNHRRRTQKALPQALGTAATTTAPRILDQTRQASASHSFASAPTATQQGQDPPDRTSSSRDGDNSPTSPTFDVDSTQIVQMALNLSESRRIAARRNVSRTNPPTLMPLPDPANGSSLRQHLQQQRRSSRNISPKPNQGTSARIPSTVRANSPLQPAFFANTESRYRYQFSSSTLARAQKAKEHLGLMAEYRRLLEQLPPLKPAAYSSPGLDGFSAGGKTTALGRDYNPLQYIRNRKVRARERKVIDGEKQGFADVDCVRSWVDEITQTSSSSGRLVDGNNFALPSFPSAEQPHVPNSPDATSKNTTRVRRPRVDWFLEPCDMIADAYWLEQDHHKQLIEDRQRRKIFPTPVNTPKLGQENAQDQGHALTSLPSARPVSTVDAKDGTLTKSETDPVLGSTKERAKERAKQKFQDITGFHHRHPGSSHTHHDFLRRRRDSISDLSGSEDESKNEPKKKTRHTRSGTITSNSNDLLQKQMMEMIAREAQERDLTNVPETDAEHSEPMVDGTPEPERHSISSPPSRFDSRKGSVVDTSDSDHKPFFDKPRWGVPPKSRTGRASLEVPDRPWQGSTQAHSSLPASPELKAAKDVFFVPTHGLDSSQPSSRAASPSRNPLSKVKQILREKGREPGRTNSHRSVEDGADNSERRSSVYEIAPIPKRETSPVKILPVSDGKPFGRQGDEASKLHRRTNSLRPRMDEPGSGLRGIFKGPRIDTVIRGGVSKLGDMLWKKDGSGDEPVEIGETDESENETPRGRRRSSTLAHIDSRRTQDEYHNTSKHFLDTMPTFQHMANVQKMPVSTGVSRPGLPQDQRLSGQPSTQFESEKPPQININSAASSAAASAAQTPMLESEVSDAESYFMGGTRNAQRDANKNQGLTAAASRFDDPSSRRLSRHWSIADQNHGEPKQLSRREVARVRTLVLVSGIKAMEISRRAYEPMPFKDAISASNNKCQNDLAAIPWDEIAKVSPAFAELRNRQVALCELYPLAARGLGKSIQGSSQQWRQAADRFSSRTSPDLRRRIWNVRQRVNDDLSGMTRSAADEADEASRDLALGQPLKIKHVVDMIDNMLRRRHRRFRWVRRALWLMVEWALVGFMWYVWFVVMILRIFWGVGSGVWRGVRWLLWL